MSSVPTPVNFPANINCCDSTLSAENRTSCNNTIATQLKTLEQAFTPNNGALFVFYKDKTFVGPPIGYKYKNTITLVDADSPADKPDNFCCRMISYLNIPADGDYQFQAIADDGARVYINNKLIINTFDPYWAHFTQPNVAIVNTSNKMKLFKSFPYLLVVEFTENRGAAGFSLNYFNNVTANYESIPSTWLVPFKPYSDSYNNYDKSMTNYCSKLDSNSLGYYQNDKLCKDFLLKNKASSLVSNIMTYCKTADNMATEFCMAPINNIINLLNTNTNLLKSDPRTVDNTMDIEHSKLFNLDFAKLATYESINYFQKKLEETDYTDENSVNFMMKFFIPAHLAGFAHKGELYILLIKNNFINDKLINYVEEYDIELTNPYLSLLYSTFKDLPNTPIRASWIKITTSKCKLENSDKKLRYQVEQECRDFIKSNTELNDTVLNFCNAENIQGQYCSDLDNAIIENRIKNIDLPVNADLADNLNQNRKKFNKQILITSNYSDVNAINYFNNQFKQLTDIETNPDNRLAQYQQYITTPEALKYCEDNYLDSNNPFCKSTLTTYGSQATVLDSLNKIKEQNCLYNNNFVTNAECIEYANKPENYNKFIQSNNTYCSTGDNIASDYCQNYYKNVEDNLSKQIVNTGFCNKTSSFENNDNSTEENNLYMILMIIFLLLTIICGAGWVWCMFKKPKNIEKLRPFFN